MKKVVGNLTCLPENEHFFQSCFWESQVNDFACTNASLYIVLYTDIQQLQLSLCTCDEVPVGLYLIQQGSNLQKSLFCKNQEILNIVVGHKLFIICPTSHMKNLKTLPFTISHIWQVAMWVLPTYCFICPNQMELKLALSSLL